MKIDNKVEYDDVIMKTSLTAMKIDNKDKTQERGIMMRPLLLFFAVHSTTSYIMLGITVFIILYIIIPIILFIILFIFSIIVTIVMIIFLLHLYRL